MGTNPSHFSATGVGKDLVAGRDTAKHPVERVSWSDAAEFCAKLSQQEQLKPFYSRSQDTITSVDGTGYRLPSEAEWEFACRSGTLTKFWVGNKDEDLVRAIWFQGTSGGRTHPAGELIANQFGLFDVHGNVWEWVQDCWELAYYGEFTEKPAINPGGPLPADCRRVVRGGGWNVSTSYCHASVRDTGTPADGFPHVGFRVSLTVDAVKAAIAGSKTKLASATGAWQGWPAGSPNPAIAPFNAPQAKKHQQEWATYLNVPVEHTNSIGMKFALIPPGEFIMGATAAEMDEALKVAGAE